MACHRVKECHKHDTNQQAVDQQHAVKAYLPAKGTVFYRRQQIAHPVVMHWFTGKELVGRDGIVFAQLSDNGHGPDKVGSEVNAISAPFRKVGPNVTKGQGNDSYRQDYQQCHRQYIAAIEAGNPQTRSQRGKSPGNDHGNDRANGQ